MAFKMKDDIRIALAQFSKAAMAGGTLVVVAACLYLALTPKSYQAGTKLVLQQRDWISTNKLHNPYDARIVPPEYNLLRSDVILGKAIENLHLAETWGKRYNQGIALKTNESLALLRTKAEIRVLPQSTVIQIQVSSENPEETATIANEIARVYREYRQSERKISIDDKVAALKKQWEDQSQKLARAEDKLKKLHFDISMARVTNSAIVYDAQGLQFLKRKRVQLETDYFREKDMLSQLKLLDRQNLRQMLPTMTTNLFLNGLLDKLREAEDELNISKTNSAPDSLQTKHAATAVSEWNRRVESAMDAILAQKAVELGSTKAELDKVVDMLQHAQTVTPNSAQPEDTVFAQAAQEVQTLRAENEELKGKLDTNTMEAVLPTAVSAEILTAAETPYEPSSPNRPIARTTMLVAGGLILLGLLTRLFTLRTKRATPSPSLN